MYSCRDYQVSTSHVKHRTSAFNMPANIYELYGMVVKACAHDANHPPTTEPRMWPASAQGW